MGRRLQADSSDSGSGITPALRHFPHLLKDEVIEFAWRDLTVAEGRCAEAVGKSKAGFQKKTFQNVGDK